jgi:1D-myo-inositol-tetrakisphosphate 5-kinase/inositol-polyphosphate multikinase
MYGLSRTAENITEAFLNYLFPTSPYGKATEEYRTYIDDNDAASADILKEKIPTKYSRWVIECFIDTITELKELIAEYPNLRLIGSSILFIYEGDRAAADATWKQMLEEDKLPSEKEEAMDGEEAEELPPKMCDLRLIDFAHSDWHADAEKQDPELLKGFDNVIKILKDCLKRQREEKF